VLRRARRGGSASGLRREPRVSSRDAVARDLKLEAVKVEPKVDRRPAAARALRCRASLLRNAHPPVCRRRRRRQGHPRRNPAAGQAGRRGFAALWDVPCCRHGPTARRQPGSEWDGADGPQGEVNLKFHTARSRITATVYNYRAHRRSLKCAGRGPNVMDRAQAVDGGANAPWPRRAHSLAPGAASRNS
jgi:hypothetical protein